MNLVQRVEHWGDTHHPQWLDIVRILLGVFLCYKGVDFLMNMGTMLALLTNKMSFGSFTSMLMSNYIAFAHILGGGLLIMGVLTRFACLLQTMHQCQRRGNREFAQAGLQIHAVVLAERLQYIIHRTLFTPALQVKGLHRFVPTDVIGRQLWKVWQAQL